MQEKRAVVVKLRLLPEEKSAWQNKAAAAGMTLSDLVRRQMGLAVAVGRQSQHRRRPPIADPELVRTVARVASNLNRIARWSEANVHPADTAQIVVALIGIERAIAAWFQARSAGGPDVD